MRPRPLPQELQFPFTTADAAALAVGPERLRRLDLATPYRGVRTHPNPDLAERCRAALRVARPGCVVSHATAAALHAIPLPSALERATTVDLTGTGSTHPTRARGIRSHRTQLDPHDITFRDGIALTGVERTWCDLGAVIPFEDLVAAGDFLIWRRAPKTTGLQLRNAVERHAGSRGRPALRGALELLSARSDSRPETKIRVRIIGAGLPVPEVNPRIYDPSGRFVAMPDLAFPRYRELVDYEGAGHWSDSKQWAMDLRRVPRLEEIGWHSTRIGAADLQDSTEFLERLSRTLRGRGWDGRTP